MQAAHQRNAVFVSILAGFFWWAFMFAKHDPSLRPIIPFGDDPYDAVGSFGAIAAGLLALLSLARTFFVRKGRPIYLLRTQAAIPFCVLVTVAAEAVAMARHNSQWVGMPGSARLIALQAALTVSSLAVLGSMKTRIGLRPLVARAVAVWAGSLLILAVYPEQLILSISGHLLTVVLGNLFLFAPVSALVEAWVPNTLPARSSRWRNRRIAQWYRGFAVAAAVGLLVGVAAYAGEWHEEPIRPAVTKILFVGGVYAGLGASGLVIAYACLGRLLGFGIGEATEEF